MLEQLKYISWNGWEGRPEPDWMDTPARLRWVCECTDMPLLVYSEDGAPESRDPGLVKRNERRMEVAARMGADGMSVNAVQDPQVRPRRDEIRATADGSDEWADCVAPTGLETSYHVHSDMPVYSIDDWRTCVQHWTRPISASMSRAQLWGCEPKRAMRDFETRLNYIHLQDWSYASRGDDGLYPTVWCDVGEAGSVDFSAIRQTFDDIGYGRIVTACLGEPLEGDGPLSAAKRSKAPVDDLRAIGY